MSRPPDGSLALVMRLRYARLTSVLVAVEEMPSTSYMLGSFDSRSSVAGIFIFCVFFWGKNARLLVIFFFKSRCCCVADDATGEALRVMRQGKRGSEEAASN